MDGNRIVDRNDSMMAGDPSADLSIAARSAMSLHGSRMAPICVVQCTIRAVARHSLPLQNN